MVVWVKGDGRVRVTYCNKGEAMQTFKTPLYLLTLPILIRAYLLTASPKPRFVSNPRLCWIAGGSRSKSLELGHVQKVPQRLRRRPSQAR